MVVEAKEVGTRSSALEFDVIGHLWEIDARIRGVPLEPLLQQQPQHSSMVGRSTRQSTVNAMDVNEASSLQPIDRLLLAQAVWELGANSWPAVAKLLTKHPLLHHPKSFFTAQVSPLFVLYRSGA